MIPMLQEWWDFERKVRQAISMALMLLGLGLPPVILSERTVHDTDKPTPAGRSPPAIRRRQGAGFEARPAQPPSL